MSTLKQFDDQLAKIKVQRDVVIKQIADLNKQKADINKQNVNANPTVKVQNEKRLSDIDAKINALSGITDVVAIQAEDAEGPVDTGMITTASAGNISQIGGEGNFAPKFGYAINAPKVSPPKLPKYKKNKAMNIFRKSLKKA